MNTAFFFRSPSFDIAELVSKALGSQEIEDMRENYSYGANTIRDGISIGSQRMINQIVSPAEIMDLEEMRCYVRLASLYPISLLKLVLNERKRTAPGFVSSNIDPDEEIEKLVDLSDLNINKVHTAKKVTLVKETQVKPKPKKNNSQAVEQEEGGIEKDKSKKKITTNKERKKTPLLQIQAPKISKIIKEQAQ
jgi:type IV secretory pathway TraG/TraD family ATPase VirD4